MDRVRVKKIVTISIAFAFTLALLLNLCFPIIKLTTGTKIEDKLADLLSLNATGFKLLAFEFSESLYAELDLFIIEEAIDIYEILFGITSTALLIWSVFMAVFISFVHVALRRDKKTKALLVTMIIGLVFALIHSVLGIVFVAINNRAIFEENKNSEVKYVSLAFIGLIILVCLLIAFVLFRKYYKAEEEDGEGKKSFDDGNIWDTVMSSVKVFVNTVRSYKRLYDADVITLEEFNGKKKRLMNEFRLRVDKIAKAIRSGSLMSFMTAETTISEILVESKALLTEEVFTEGEYAEWKTYFFTLIS